ncbi:FAS1-like dehydratase domain-containing protein [Aestuariivirga sp.]|uniref:FAS1-like dehydratase domain-containing protein n=1 Tax=Aestuariivirga sp. TaxID=2650926 RepID=UPI003BAA86FD
MTPRLLAEYRATLAPFLFETENLTCPPGLHFGLAPAIPRAEDVGPDGAERMGLSLPPITLPRRMWAGGLIETLRPLRCGVQISRTSTITGIRMKHGSTGAFCLVSVQHEIADEQGPAIRDRQDLVFREAADGLAPAVGDRKETRADWTIEPSPLLLFRFSAFTFNAHRIHYDVAHASAEGYPGLLVHGPLQAALLLNLAATRLGQVPEHFAYRCLNPLYAGPAFGVAYENETESARVIRSDGVITAEGRIRVPGTG